jgi:hypothetical protein
MGALPGLLGHHDDAEGGEQLGAFEAPSLITR